jgi:hypothetical protein
LNRAPIYGSQRRIDGMKAKAVEKAVQLGAKVGGIFIATADSKGLPHVAVSGRIELEKESRIAVTEWFCPGTLSNLQVNPRISLVVWDPQTDAGYQILGQSEGVEDVAMMDGLVNDKGEEPIPQVRRKILVNAERVIHFSRAPHSDLEE